MIPVFDTLDLQDPVAVARAFRDGAAANRDAACRRGSIDVAEAPDRLIASGDLHDNPAHLARLLLAAGLDDPSGTPKAHLTLHEIIHGDQLMGGMDFSFRALARVAHAKATFPEHLHTLLANHELGQIVGSGIVKGSVRVVDAFNDGIDHTFGDDAPQVHESIELFIRSMPLALRTSGPGGDILCSHSLPSAASLATFDTTVLERDLVEGDYESRVGAAYHMTWGRGHPPELLKTLAERWGVSLFLLGHESAETGIEPLPPNGLILNSDHERGVYLPVDLSAPPDLATGMMSVVPLSAV